MPTSDPQDNVGLVAVLRARTGRSADLEALLRKVVEEASTEPGTLLYELTVHQQDQDEFYVLELFKDADAVAAHNQSAALEQLLARADDLLDGGIRITPLRRLLGRAAPSGGASTGASPSAGAELDRPLGGGVGVGAAERPAGSAPSARMLAQTLTAFGDTSGFELREVEKPQAAAGQLLVKVHASSVNVADVKARALGHALDFVPSLPAVLGMDFAGVVEAVGAGVDGYAAGDKVFGCAGGVLTLPGTLAEYVSVDARLAAHAPRMLSLEQAAALPLVSITAYEALFDRARVKPGEHVLVHGGSGGVGHIAVQLAHAYGCQVTATETGRGRMDNARRLGADNVVDYLAERVEEYTERLTGGQGFDIVFDTVGGDNLNASMLAARRNGRVVTTVSLQAYDLVPAHVKGLSLHVVYMLMPMMYDTGRERHGEILRAIAAAADAGEVAPLVDSTFALADVARAHDRLDGGEAIGKVLVLSAT